jgi:hypothetical protein
MAAEKSYCLYCNKVLRGRSDKKFCDDNCRNAYNNQLKKDEDKAYRKIDKSLKKNRRILKQILGESKTRSVTEKQLLQKGFEFRHHTHHFLTRNGDEYLFCYDYGWLPRKDKFMIVKEIPFLRE